MQGTQKGEVPVLIETWKPVVGYETIYEVSNAGRVRSLDRVMFVDSRNTFLNYKGVVLKQRLNNKGYYVVNLHKNNVMKSKTVHRLVAEAFIPNPNKLPAVNHLDTDRKNNTYENLEWCTFRDNIVYHLSNDKRIRTLSKPVIARNLNTGDITTFSSVCEAHDITGANKGSIGRCANGFLRKAGNYVWEWER